MVLARKTQNTKTCAAASSRKRQQDQCFLASSNLQVVTSTNEESLVKTNLFLDAS